MAQKSTDDLLKKVLSRLPEPKDPYEELRTRLAHIEVWHSVWRWLFPVAIVLIIGFIQILVAIFK